MKKTANKRKLSARKKNANFERIMRGLEEATSYAQGNAEVTKKCSTTTRRGTAA